MAVVTMKQLLEAGVHFGHQTRRWNPKMKRFIFGERNGIYIIDLNQTLERIDGPTPSSATWSPTAGPSSSSAPRSRRRTRWPATPTECGMPYINERWLGGMLTNFNTISGRVKKMQEYERMRAAGDFEAMPKKEALILTRELEKLQRNLGGIRNMARLPEAVFIIDTKKEHIAVTEANKLGHADRRRRRHQLRPRPHQVRDPGQRRRHPGRHPDVPDHRRRGRGGPLHRLPPGRPVQRGGRRPAGPDAEEEARRAEQQREARRQAAIQAQEREARLAAASARPTPDQARSDLPSPPPPAHAPAPRRAGLTLRRRRARPGRRRRRRPPTCPRRRRRGRRGASRRHRPSRPQHGLHRHSRRQPTPAPTRPRPEPRPPLPPPHRRPQRPQNRHERGVGTARWQTSPPRMSRRSATPRAPA